MKREPLVGDVIRIGNGKKDQLVIRASDDSEYTNDGHLMLPTRFVFVTIPFDVGVSIDPKEKKYLTSCSGEAMQGETKVSLTDLTLICTVKVKLTVSKTFTVKA